MITHYKTRIRTHTPTGEDYPITILLSKQARELLFATGIPRNLDRTLVYNEDLNRFVLTWVEDNNETTTHICETEFPWVRTELFKLLDAYKGEINFIAGKKIEPFKGNLSYYAIIDTTWYFIEIGLLQGFTIKELRKFIHKKILMEELAKTDPFESIKATTAKLLELTEVINAISLPVDHPYYQLTPEQLVAKKNKLTLTQQKNLITYFGDFMSSYLASEFAPELRDAEALLFKEEELVTLAKKVLQDKETDILYTSLATQPKETTEKLDNNDTGSDTHSADADDIDVDAGLDEDRGIQAERDIHVEPFLSEDDSLLLSTQANIGKVSILIGLAALIIFAILNILN